MKLIMYAIFDESMQEFGPIMEAKNDLVAMRGYIGVVDKLPLQVRNDYKLYKIGVFDTEDGLIESYGPIKVNMDEAYKLALNETHKEALNKRLEEINEQNS